MHKSFLIIFIGSCSDNRKRSRTSVLHNADTYAFSAAVFFEGNNDGQNMSDNQFSILARLPLCNSYPNCISNNTLLTQKNQIGLIAPTTNFSIKNIYATIDIIRIKRRKQRKIGKFQPIRKSPTHLSDQNQIQNA